MHTTTTCINTTFERVEVGLGSFPTLVCCLLSGVGGWERERAFWSGSGLGLRFRSWGLSGAGAGSSALSGLFGLPWISVPGFGARSVGWGANPPARGFWPGGVQC
ncbi:hypothetical protein ILYODFUR_031131 [Ilyodon furcidens]|uniref:Uncharacterized protein n=1 Tax=Ilyodon furcidens TaxID=33524 RepID=A0ABV0V8B4_9TELE